MKDDDAAMDVHDEVFFEEAAADAPRLARPNPQRGQRRVTSAVLALILIVGGYFLFHQLTKKSDTLKLQGKVALSESELKSLVNAKKLVVYWVGPQAGAKYTLVATTPGVSFVKYLPDGKGLGDTKNAYRAIGTYVQRNAFAVNKSAGAVAGNVGFTNVDGNAVFYAKARPTNVYMGLKDKDVQIEIFDPLVDQALGVALIRNQVSQVK